MLRAHLTFQGLASAGLFCVIICDGADRREPSRFGNRFFRVKAVAYCRVSTVGQRDEGISLEMQQDRIATWCVNNGYEPDAVFVEVMSGGRAANRPELQKAVALACRQKGTRV